MAKEYDKVIKQLDNLKELNKIMKSNALVYLLQQNGIVIMNSDYSPVDRIGMLNNPEKFDCYFDMVINAPLMTSFCTAYTKTNTTYDITSDSIKLCDKKKEVEIELPISKDNFITSQKCYSKLFIDENLTQIVTDIVMNPESYDSKFIAFTDEERDKLENKEAIGLSNGLYISKAVIDTKKADRVSFMTLDYMEDIKHYALIKVEYKEITIYTLIAFIL